MSSFFSLNIAASKTPSEPSEIVKDIYYTTSSTTDFTTVTDLYFTRNPKKYVSDFEEIHTSRVSLSLDQYILYSQFAVNKNELVCGGAQMALDNVYDFVNNVELSNFDRPIWTCIYDANLFTNSLALTEFRLLLTSCPDETITDCSINAEGKLECQEIEPSAVNPTSCNEAKEYYNNLLLPTFCGQQHVSTDAFPCPDNQPTCSRFVEPGPDGEYCRVWELQNADNKDVLTVIDNVKEQYCLNNPLEEDCACLSRSLSINYNQLKINSPDYCWYLPCVENATHLTVSRDQSRVNAESCANACEQVFNIYAEDVNRIIFDETFQSVVDCNFQEFDDRLEEEGNQGGGGGGGGGEVVTPEASFFSQYGVIIILVSVFALVLILIVIAFTVPKNKK